MAAGELDRVLEGGHRAERVAGRLQGPAELELQVGRAGVGVDNIDVDACSRRGIVVVNAPYGNVVSAAEHTVGMLLALVERIRLLVLERARLNKRLGEIVLSVNPFVPKPFTPFQWCGMEDGKSLESKGRFLRQAFGKMANVRLLIRTNASATRRKGHAIMNGSRSKSDAISAVFRQPAFRARRIHARRTR